MADQVTPISGNGVDAVVMLEVFGHGASEGCVFAVAAKSEACLVEQIAGVTDGDRSAVMLAVPMHVFVHQRLSVNDEPGKIGEVAASPDGAGVIAECGVGVIGAVQFAKPAEAKAVLAECNGEHLCRLQRHFDDVSVW